MDEQELYIAPLAVYYVMFPEGILCDSDGGNVEDPEEDEIFEW